MRSDLGKVEIHYICHRTKMHNAFDVTENYLVQSNFMQAQIYMQEKDRKTKKNRDKPKSIYSAIEPGRRKGLGYNNKALLT